MTQKQLVYRELMKAIEKLLKLCDSVIAARDNQGAEEAQTQVAEEATKTIEKVVEDIENTTSTSTPAKEKTNFELLLEIMPRLEREPRHRIVDITQKINKTNLKRNLLKGNEEKYLLKNGKLLIPIYLSEQFGLTDKAMETLENIGDQLHMNHIVLLEQTASRYAMNKRDFLRSFQELERKIKGLRLYKA